MNEENFDTVSSRQTDDDDQWIEIDNPWVTHHVADEVEKLTLMAKMHEGID